MKVEVEEVAEGHLETVKLWHYLCDVIECKVCGKILGHPGHLDVDFGQSDLLLWSWRRCASYPQEAFWMRGEVLKITGTRLVCQLFTSVVYMNLMDVNVLIVLFFFIDYWFLFYWFLVVFVLSLLLKVALGVLFSFGRQNSVLIKLKCC